MPITPASCALIAVRYKKETGRVGQRQKRQPQLDRRSRPFQHDQQYRRQYHPVETEQAAFRYAYIRNTRKAIACNPNQQRQAPQPEPILDRPWRAARLRLYPLPFLRGGSRTPAKDSESHDDSGNYGGGYLNRGRVSARAGRRRRPHDPCHSQPLRKERHQSDPRVALGEEDGAT